MITLQTAAWLSQARLGAHGRLSPAEVLVAWPVLSGPGGRKDKARGQSTLFICPQRQHFWVFWKLLGDDVLTFKSSLRGGPPTVPAARGADAQRQQTRPRSGAGEC